MEEQLQPVKDHIVEERVRPTEGDDPGLSALWPPVWMTTYADLVTQLMTFFILLYALTMVQYPQDLVEIATDSRERIMVQGDGTVNYPDPRQMIEDALIWKEIQQLSREEQLALSELRALHEIAKEFQESLEKGKLEQGVKIKITAEDVTIIPLEQMIFAAGSDRVKATFLPVLERLAVILKDKQASIRIEGHTDDTPIDPLHRDRFPTNYELSTARAVAVANYFIERHAILPERIYVAGYGPLIPRYPPGDPEKKAFNRRVEFHIFVTSEFTVKPG